VLVQVRLHRQVQKSALFHLRVVPAVFAVFSGSWLGRAVFRRFRPSNRILPLDKKTACETLIATTS
jgi:hypothetical protein